MPVAPPLRNELSMLRHTLRQWTGAPAATIVMVLTLGLTVGGVATVFTTFDALLLHPLPVRDPERLVRVAAISPRGETRDMIQWSDFQTLRHVTDQVSVAAYLPGSAVLRDPATGRTEVVGVERISDRFFDVAGARLLRGAVPRGGERAAVVSERFAGATTIVLDDTTYSVTGVAAFRGTNIVTPADVWVPLGPVERVRLIGRLAPGASPADAEHALSAALLDRTVTASVRVGPERAMLIAPENPRMLSVAIAIASLLALGVVLVAATNIIGMLLARVTLRRRELAVRAALGATGGRIVRQVIGETLPIAVPSVLIAQLVAMIGSRTLSAFLPPALGSVDNTPGIRVAIFAAALSLLATLFAGAVVAVHARRTGPGALGARGSVEGVPPGLRGMVVVQLAFTVVVLIAAGLLVQTARAYRSVDPGFEYARQLTVSFSGATPSPSRLRELAERVRAIRGVTHVSMARNIPMGRQTPSVIGVGDERRDGYVSQIEGDFFGGAGMPLLRGRTLEKSDDGFAVVNQAAQAGLGQTLAVDGRTLVVVGVVRDTRMSSLAESPKPYVWLPWDGVAPVRLQVRATRDLGAVMSDISALLRGAGVAASVTRLEEIVEADRLIAEAVALLASALGSLALLLASVGLFGVVSTITTSRRRQLAVRMALGATPFRMARLVALASARLALLGLVLGAALVVPMSRALASVLFGVHPFDAATWGVVPIVLATVIACATLIPAARAMKLDPGRLLSE